MHITYIIPRLDQYKAYNPDGIPAIILRNVCQKLHLLPVNCTINPLIFLWRKSSTAVPIFKNLSEYSDHCNYRPIIIILPLFEKVLELVKRLNSQGLASEKQYGFRVSKSHISTIIMSDKF